MHENAIFSPRRGGVRRVRPMLDPPLNHQRYADDTQLSMYLSEFLFIGPKFNKKHS